MDIEIGNIDKEFHNLVLGSKNRMMNLSIPIYGITKATLYVILHSQFVFTLSCCHVSIRKVRICFRPSTLYESEKHVFIQLIPIVCLEID